MSILVTGGSGFVGLNLAEQLVGRGESVVIYSLSAPPAAAVEEITRAGAAAAAAGKPGGKLAVVHGDTTDRAALDGAFRAHGVKRVIHAAAITAGPERDAKEPRRIAEVNLIGTINVLEAARAHGVGRFVHASTGALYGASGVNVGEPLDEERHRPVPDTMYGITKYAAERTCIRLAGLWNMDLLIGRLGQVYGRWEYSTGLRDSLSLPTQLARLALKANKGSAEAVFPVLGDTDYIYGPDIAHSLIALLDAKAAPHRLFHLGNGRAWALPAWCERLQARFPDFRWRESVDLKECNVIPLALTTRTVFSNKRLTSLGWSPRFEIDAAVADYTAWLAARPDFQ